MEKKFVIFGIILMMLFLLGSCNSEEEKLGNGTFYNLEEAYDLDLLSVEDLQSIAYYYRGSEDESFVPKTKNPETLSQETESKIKQLYLDDLKKSVSEAKVEDIYIAEYYGSYGDCVVVKVWDNIVDYDLFSIPEQLIGGVLFNNYCEREIYVWTDHSIKPLLYNAKVQGYGHFYSVIISSEKFLFVL